MGLGDFLKGAYKTVNEGAYKATKGLGNIVDENINRLSPLDDIHPFGGSVEAINTTGKVAEYVGADPGRAAAGVGHAAKFAWDNPGEVGKGALKFAESQASPEKLLETAIIAGTTMGVGAIAAEGAGATEAITSASRMSRFSEAANIDKALGTGEASLAKKLMHPVNTFVTQPIKDKAAQALLDVGGDAGALRQGAAMGIQGSGVAPKALTGLSDEAAATQQLTRRVLGAQSRTSQFQSGNKGLNAVVDPVGTAKSLAMGHKKELMDYATAHPQEADKALQAVTGRKGGIGPSGLQRARENITTAESGGGGGYQPPQVQATTGGGGEEPTPQSLSTSQFMQPQPAMQPLQQPSSSQPSSAYQSGRGFSPNQGMPSVSQPAQPDRALSWTRTLGMTALSYHSQKRFWEGPNREVFRGIDANHDWRHIEQRNNQISFKVHPVMMARPGAGEGNVGAEGDPSNMREPRNDGKPQPSLSASVAEPYTAMGQQPEGALNPAMPRMIQPSTRSAMFKSGSVFDRNPALPSLSQPLSRPSDPYGISSSLAEINRNAEEMMPDVTAGGLLRAGAQAMKNRRGANDVLGV